MPYKDNYHYTSLFHISRLHISRLFKLFPGSNLFPANILSLSHKVEVDCLKLNQIDDTRRKRAVIIFLVAILFISFKGFLSPVVDVGFVLQKEVVGVEEEGRFIVFRSGFEGVSVQDVACGQLLPEGAENLLINESVETELKTRYPEIEYVVLMRLCVEDEIREYRVSREDFNRLDIGVVAKYEVYRSEKDLIKRIIEI